MSTKLSETRLPPRNGCHDHSSDGKPAALRVVKPGSRIRLAQPTGTNYLSSPLLRRRRADGSVAGTCATNPAGDRMVRARAVGRARFGVYPPISGLLPFGW